MLSKYNQYYDINYHILNDLLLNIINMLLMLLLILIEYFQKCKKIHIEKNLKII